MIFEEILLHTGKNVITTSDLCNGFITNYIHLACFMFWPMLIHIFLWLGFNKKKSSNTFSTFAHVSNLFSGLSASGRCDSDVVWQLWRVAHLSLVDEPLKWCETCWANVVEINYLNLQRSTFYWTPALEIRYIGTILFFFPII